MPATDILGHTYSRYWMGLFFESQVVTFNHLTSQFEFLLVDFAGNVSHQYIHNGLVHGICYRVWVGVPLKDNC